MSSTTTPDYQRDTEADVEEINKDLPNTALDAGGAELPVYLAIQDGPLPVEEWTLSTVTKLGGVPTVMKMPPHNADKRSSSNNNNNSSSSSSSSLAGTVFTHMNRACGRCKRPMFLIAQCYCPVPEDEAGAYFKKVAAEMEVGAEKSLLAKQLDAYTDEVVTWNRMLYVFGCNAATCSAQSSSADAQTWRAFSVLVRAEDPEVSEESTDAKQDVAPTTAPDDAAAIAEVAKSGSQNTSGGDKNIPFSFSPIALFTDEEPSNESLEPTSDEEKRLFAKAEEAQRKATTSTAIPTTPENTAEGGGFTSGSDDDATTTTRKELHEMEQKIDLRNKNSDVAYECFRARMSREPHQALRYARGGQPLFMDPAHYSDIVKKSQPMSTTTATACSSLKGKGEHFTCAQCGTSLMMELQVMPTAVYFLDVAQHTESVGGGEGLDFGTLTVFVCPNFACERNLIPEGHRSRTSSTRTVGQTPQHFLNSATAAGVGEKGNGGRDTKVFDLDFVVLQEEVLFVEPPPSMEGEKKARDASVTGGQKQTLHQFMNASNSNEEEEKGALSA